MKMIRNTNEAVPSPSRLILLIGLLLIGAALRSRHTAGIALAEWLPQRFGAPLLPPVLAGELAQLAGLAHPWLRDVAGVAVSGRLSRSRAVSKDARTACQGDAT